MKGTIHVTVEKNNGTVVTKSQRIEAPWPYRESKATFAERMEKAAVGAVKSCLK